MGGASLLDLFADATHDAAHDVSGVDEADPTGIESLFDFFGLQRLSAARNVASVEEADPVPFCPTSPQAPCSRSFRGGATETQISQRQQALSANK